MRYLNIKCGYKLYNQWSIIWHIWIFLYMQLRWVKTCHLGTSIIIWHSFCYIILLTHASIHYNSTSRDTIIYYLIVHIWSNYWKKFKLHTYNTKSWIPIYCEKQKITYAQLLPTENKICLLHLFKPLSFSDFVKKIKMF